MWYYICTCSGSKGYGYITRSRLFSYTELYLFFILRWKNHELFETISRRLIKYSLTFSSLNPYFNPNAFKRSVYLGILLNYVFLGKTWNSSFDYDRILTEISCEGKRSRCLHWNKHRCLFSLLKMLRRGGHSNETQCSDVWYSSCGCLTLKLGFLTWSTRSRRCRGRQRKCS